MELTNGISNTNQQRTEGKIKRSVGLRLIIVGRSRHQAHETQEKVYFRSKGTKSLSTHTLVGLRN